MKSPITNSRLKNAWRKHTVPHKTSNLIRDYVYLLCILINMTSVTCFMQRVPNSLKIHSRKVTEAKRAIQFQEQQIQMSHQFSSMRKSQVMVMTSPDDIINTAQKTEQQKDISGTIASNNVNETSTSSSRKRKKYTRKRPQTRSEQELMKIQQARKAKYEELRQKSEQTNIFAFESLFPDPVFDVETVNRDLYEVSNRDALAGKMGEKKKTWL